MRPFYFILLALFGSSLFAASTNDFFAQRRGVTGTNIVTTSEFTGATREEGEPHKSPASLWWEWTAPFSGGVALEISNAYLSPAALAFTGEALTNLALVSFPAPPTNGWGYNKVNFRATEGVTYFIAAAGSTNNTIGNVVLRIKPGPANDHFAAATPVTFLNARYPGMLHGATPELGDPQLSNNSAGASVWWKWSPATSGEYFFSGAVADGSANLALFEGESLPSLTKLAQGTWDYGSTAAKILHYATAGQTYYILGTDAYGYFPTIYVKVQSMPTNDYFAFRTLISGTNVTGTLSVPAATREEGEPHHYGGSLWWEWTAPFSGGVALEGLGDLYTPGVLAYQGENFADLTRVSMPPRLGAPLPTNAFTFGRASFRAIEGERYQLALVGQSTLSGNLTLKVSPGPANDDFTNARPILRAVSSLSTLMGATSEPTETQVSTNSLGASVWWKWTPEVSKGFGISVASPAGAVWLSIYQGDSLTNLTLLGVDSSGDGVDSARVNLRVQGDGAYYIRVADWGGYLDRVTVTTREAPPHDDFTNAAPVTTMFLSGTTLGATKESTDPVAPNSKGNTVWYKWIPPQTGGYELQLSNGSSALWSDGNILRIFRGDSISNLSPVIQVETEREQPVKTVFRASADQTYYFLVEGKTDGGGQFVVNLTKSLASDSFENRELLTEIGAPVTASTVGATRELGEPMHNGDVAARTLWWQFKAPATRGYYLGFASPQESAGFAIYQGDSVTNLVAVPATLAITWDNRSYTAFRAVAGETYQVVYYDSEPARNITFTIAESPQNDDFANALELAAMTLDGNITGATREPQEPVLGPGSSQGGGTLWYKWVVPAPGTYGVSTSLGQVGVYRGTQLAELQSPDYRLNPNSFSAQNFQATQGETIYIVVNSFVGAPFTLRLSSGPPNDNFAARAELITGTTNQVEKFIATTEQGEPPHAPGFLINSLWWKWTAPETGGYRLSIPAPQFTTAFLNIYTGTELSALTLITNTAGVGVPLLLDFHAQAGMEYAIAFGQSLEMVGPLQVIIKPASSNDAWAAALPLLNSLPTANRYTGATLEPGERTDFGPSHGTVWYRWTAPANGSFAFEVISAQPNLGLGVYTGEGMLELVPLKIISGWTSSQRNVSFRAAAGTEYWLAAAVPFGSTEHDLSASMRLGHPSDDFANAELLQGATFLWSGTTVASTMEPGEEAFTIGDRSTVWARWTAPDSGVYRLKSTSASVAVFSGQSIAALEKISQLVSGLPEFNALAGETYYLRADTASNGQTTFSVKLGKKPVNDSITESILVDGTEITITASTWLATRSTGEMYESVWWRWVAPQDGIVRLVAPVSLSLEVIHAKVPTLSSNVAFFRPTFGPSTNAFVVTRGVEYRIGLASAVPEDFGVQMKLDPLEDLGFPWLQALPSLIRGGTVPWTNQPGAGQFGRDALKITLSTAAEGWLEASYPGPGALQFSYKTTPGYNFALMISANSTFFPSEISLPASTNWTSHTVQLRNTNNVIRWTYESSSLRPKSLIRPPSAGSVWVENINWSLKPPLPLRFSSFLTPAGEFRLSMAIEPQRTYTLEHSTNLVEWITWTNFFNPTFNTIRSFTIPRTPVEGGTYFRGSVR